jgi:ABC-type cobalamin/Fe3+-siderophores transport system ATPase subunit
MTLIELEKQVSQLPPDQLAKFIQWVKQLDSDLWDRQIEQDVAAGRLDHLAAEAIAEDDAGRATSL